MAGSVNKVIIVGKLGRDPEIRTFNNGGKIASLRVATSESWKDRTTGERKEKTEWHQISIKAEGLVGVAERMLQKGTQIYAEGSLETRKWQDQNGNDRYSTEVVLAPFSGTLHILGGARGTAGPDDRRAASTAGAASTQAQGHAGGSVAVAPDYDDEIPF